MYIWFKLCKYKFDASCRINHITLFPSVVKYLQLKSHVQHAIIQEVILNYLYNKITEKLTTKLNV